MIIEWLTMEIDVLRFNRLHCMYHYWIYGIYKWSIAQPATKTTRDSNTWRPIQYTHISKRKYISPSSSVIILVFVHGVLLYFIPCNFVIRTNLLTQNTIKNKRYFFIGYTLLLEKYIYKSILLYTFFVQSRIISKHS